ncbi:hypothetical protein GLAREA_07810 [Glarea lozoyensis ATCC 20868]|uniref:Uncharacterized protein n=1 Tax=Glarea lozoyensis (strain ATCC 20868 / MF5171) TaxID=1116229 RepID=S3DKU0_GLAL2|nr:uncharacterized protein GLAREA_07810 [Glarea lozoyensis ATCC 20868]EPE32676.1 hypothetical protein GLAREA_07810 [Glarea lozoyensis ATCC 20868]
MRPQVRNLAAKHSRRAKKLMLMISTVMFFLFLLHLLPSIKVQAWSSDDEVYFGWPFPLYKEMNETHRAFVLRGPPHPVRRYSPEYKRVACWQNDGVWIAKLSPIEMAHLEVNPFHNVSRSMNQADEDDFCARLRTYGASFWDIEPSISPYPVRSCHYLDCYRNEPKINVDLKLGFPPSGGAWVLKVGENGLDYQTVANSGLDYALTMEDRCLVLKDLGAKFCSSLAACSETASFLTEPAILLEEVNALERPKDLTLYDLA